MNIYLARLKALNSAERATARTDKADGSPSVSSVSTRSAHLCEAGQPFVSSVGSRGRPTVEKEGDESLRHPTAEARRLRVLYMLGARPELRYALIADECDPQYPGCVVFGMAIRKDDGTVYTADLIVPAERYDGMAVLHLLERHNGGSTGGAQ